MKDLESKECEVHVLVCTNERPEGKSCCKKVGGQEFYTALKTKLKEVGLYNSHWITRTGCLGFCNNVGTTVAIHRAGQPAEWFNEVTYDDFDTIWAKIVEKK